MLFHICFVLTNRKWSTASLLYFLLHTSPLRGACFIRVIFFFFLLVWSFFDRFYCILVTIFAKKTQEVHSIFNTCSSPNFLCRVQNKNCPSKAFLHIPSFHFLQKSNFTEIERSGWFRFCSNCFFFLSFFFLVIFPFFNFLQKKKTEKCRNSIIWSTLHVCVESTMLVEERDKFLLPTDKKRNFWMDWN